LKTTQKKHRLPTLQENIKCGNSLIDDSAIAGSKAFKWEEKFKEIMSNGGFDVVIGNPPWSSKIASDTNRILAKKWDISEKNVNICALFILESLKKVKPNGFFGFLLPKVVIKNEAYYPIRKEILDNYHLKEIVDFGQFPGVASDAVALIIQNKKEDTDTEVLFYDGSILKERNKVDQKIFQKNQGLVFSLSLTPQLQGIIDKIVNNSKQLSELFKIKRGIELGQKSLITKCSNCGCYNEAETKYYGSTDKKCKKCKTKLNISRDNCIQISSSSNDKRYDTKCVSGTQLQRYSTAGFYHILSSLKGIDYKEDAFSSQKILLKRIATKIEGTFSEDKQLAFNTVYSVYNEKFSRNQFLFTLGILNSKLIHFYYEHSYNIGMNLTTQVTIDFLSTIPIKTILEAQQKPIADSVDRILSLNKRLNELGDKMTDERKVLEDEITKTDEQIDELIYKIYGISEDEKRIIEDSLNKT
jgi:hypothetical protein